MSLRAVNLTDHASAVPIFNKDTGEQREIFVQPNGRPKIPEGFTVSSTFLFRNPGFKVVNDSPVPTASSVLPNVTSSTSSENTD